MAGEKLRVGAVGGEVARLHEDLQRHGFELPASEVGRQFFGPGTRDAVLRCQQEGGLACSGDVDASTTGVLAGPPSANIRSGAIESGGRTALREVALPPALRLAIRPSLEKPSGGRPVAPQPPEDPLSPPSADAPPAGEGLGGEGAASLGQRVTGQILLEHGLPASKIKLRLYDRGFGGATTLLGEMETDESGQYEARYEVAEGNANIEIHALSGEQEIPLSKTRFGAGKDEELNLIAPGSLQPLAPEYQRLAADLTPHIGSMAQLASARENAERQDLTVLNRATGWDARVLALAANASTLSADP